MINIRLWASIQFHDDLNRICAGRGMGMTTMEINLAQELASINQDPLFFIFLDLSNSYDMVERSRLIRTLEGYGMGPQICNLCATFWAHQ